MVTGRGGLGLGAAALGEHSLLDVIRCRLRPLDASDGSTVDEHAAALEVDLDDLLDGHSDRAAPNPPPADDQGIRPIGARAEFELGNHTDSPAGIEDDETGAT